MASTDARPVPLKNAAYRAYFPILDADGDFVTGATGLDSEVSKDGGSFTDCTNEATEIGSSGIYYLDLTSTEMNADAVVVQVKTSSSGAKTTPLVMYPEEAGDIRTNLTQCNGNAVAAGAIPNAAAATNGGLPTVDGNNRIVGIQGTLTTLDALDTAQDAQHSTTQTAIADLPTNAELAAALAAADDAVLAAIAALNNLSAAQVNSEVDSALADYDGPTYTELLNLFRLALRKDTALATDLASLLTTINANLGSGAGAYANSTEALEALRDRGDAAWVTATGFSTLDAAGVRAAVGLAAANLDTQLGDLPTNAELATALAAADDAILAAIAALNNLSSAQAQTAAAAALAAYDPPTRTEATADKEEVLTAVGTPLQGGDYTAPDNAGIAAVKAKTDNLPASPAAVGSAMTLTSSERNAVADALLDRASAIDGYTVRQALQIIGASVAGELSGAATTTVTITGLDGSTTRLTVTVDADGNRSAVDYDV